MQQLIADLRKGSAVAREAAIARLRVVGSRAVTRLSALVHEDSQAAVRGAGLRALDGIDDVRVVDVSIKALNDPEADVRLAAIAALRGWVLRDSAARVMDALAGIALDENQSAAVRGAAREALAQLPAGIVEPLLTRTPPTSHAPAEDDPRAIQGWVTSHPDAPLASLHDLVARLRAREQEETRRSWKAEWLTVRGALHAALARRGSLIALYDLREAFETAEAPLPREFLSAMADIGDTTCLEPMAKAWSRAAADSPWREQLAERAADLVKRAGLTARSPVLKKLRSRWPGFV